MKLYEIFGPYEPEYPYVFAKKYILDEKIKTIKDGGHLITHGGDMLYDVWYNWCVDNIAHKEANEITTF